MSIPLGIANRRWKHGDIHVFDKIIHEHNRKESLIYCNIDVRTNPSEREYCLEQVNPIMNAPRVDFEAYLRALSKSYFVISPNGRGIDCHRHWEALYVGTIPIVTDSINIRQYFEYPFVVLDSWKHFHETHLTVTLYDEMWKSFDQSHLYCDVEACQDASRRLTASQHLRARRRFFTC